MSDRALSRLLADQYYHSMVAARRRGPVWSVTDLGELAIRLGSVVSFDRRGDVVWIDDFEHGIGKWVANVWGVGGAVELSDAYARSGNWSMAMVAGSDGLRKASVYRMMPRPVVGGLGFCFSFGMDARLDELRVLFDLYDGAHRHEPFVVYDYVELALKVRGSDGELQTIAEGLDIYESYYPFWSQKLVVDFEKLEYVRWVFQDVEYDLRGISYLYNVDTGNPYLRPGIQVIGQEGFNAVVYVDDVVLTENEGVE